MRKLAVITLSNALLLALGLAGCASVPEQKLGTNLPKASSTMKVTMYGKGTLFVSQRLTEGAPNCFLLKDQLTVKVRKEAEATPEKLDVSCNFLKGSLTVLTKSSIAKGNYLVEVSRTGGIKGFSDKPLIAAKYDDPDSAGGPEYSIDGAKMLEAGQNVVGRVSYPEAKSTQWVRVKGKGAQVALTFVDSSDDGDLTADVYEYNVRNRTPKLIGRLSHKKRAMFPDNVLVKVSAKPYGTQGNFALLRGDAGGGAGVAAKGAPRIGVIDCYSTGPSSAVVLLRKTLTMKVSDEITVYGKTAEGKHETLGLCQVTAIQGDQASCKMDVGLTSTYVEYRAEAKNS